MSAIAVVGQDPVANAAVAMGLARTQALARRTFVLDFLGDGSTLTALGDDAAPGVSDMIRYGVSLGHAARQLPESPNLFVISGGMESPLAEDVLTSLRWRSLSDIVHKAGGLLLMVMPAHLPHEASFLSQLDGAMVVGEGTQLPTGVRLLGEVHTAATMRTPAIPVKSVDRAGPARSGLARAALALLVVAVSSMALPQVREPALRAFRSLVGGEASTSAQPVAAPALPTPVEVPWSVELLFTNAETDAATRVAVLADSLPATTYVPVAGEDSTMWYRVLSGAFADSLSAAAFLASRRESGDLTPESGLVTRTPFALLLDSTADATIAGVQLQAYIARGIPAYSLRSITGLWRIYAGAFSLDTMAAPLRERLQSSNISSVLAVREGSSQ